ncbi:hydroxymethylglutaryl-CoA lyase [Limisalsivibrio acetivorans]|uniref:hydroxymethylglutaryl-CoA lyase n=1 Tax=Limisalsivibrio acetivorans TaxID=1304888 RepID=UPI0003B3E6FA|nr:hydroxymethylglutaryl-CoA lyase [Limisalsivibrio acetivorans]
MGRIQLEEVGLREGLQSNPEILTMEQKVNLIDMVMESGIERIQLGSFVNEKRVPQMAGVEELFQRYADKDGVLFSGLVLNRKGLERAVECGVKLLNISISASDTHNRENTGKGIAEALPGITDMIKEAVSAGIRVRAGIQAAFGCYYEGRVDEERVYTLTEKYLEAGADEIGLSDTAGFARPAQVERICRRVSAMSGDRPLGLHMHDTFGMAMANVLAGIEGGAVIFDSSVAGMGGCPFMKGAPGNQATEDMVYMLQSMGELKSVSLGAIVKAAELAKGIYGREFNSRISVHYPLIEKLNLTD